MRTGLCGLGLGVFPLGTLLSACLLVFCLTTPAGALEIDCSGPEPVWSATEPPVNLTHIFCGEINRRGRPVGFHARPHGADPPNARLIDVTDGPNALGVYTAEVAVRRPATGWQTADEKFSSFFPDRMTPQQVLDAVLAAFHDAQGGDARNGQGKWRGDPGLGFLIEGWLLPDGRRINTAWPIYVEGAP